MVKLAKANPDFDDFSDAKMQAAELQWKSECRNYGNKMNRKTINESLYSLWDILEHVYWKNYINAGGMEDIHGKTQARPYPGTKGNDKKGRDCRRTNTGNKLNLNSPI